MDHFEGWTEEELGELIEDLNAEYRAKQKAGREPFLSPFQRFELQEAENLLGVRLQEAYAALEVVRAEAADA